MLCSLMSLALSNKYTVSKTSLTITGTDPVTKQEVSKNVDIKSIEYITIGEGITEIQEEAFYNSNVNTLSLPRTLEKFDAKCLRYCGNINTFILAPGNNYFELYNGILYTIGKSTLVRMPSTYTSITIPNSCRKIQDHAFNLCTRLETLFIPNSVTELETGFIWDCGVKSIIFRSGSQITYLNEYNFAFCRSLEYIYLPKSIMTIDSNAFYECWNLTTVVFEEASNLTFVKGLAFANCGIANCTFPSKVTRIGSQVFQGVKNLASIHIPASVTDIDVGFMDMCVSNPIITIDSSNVNYKSQYPILLGSRNDKYIIAIYPNATEFTLPENAEFSPYLLQQCLNLININVARDNMYYASDGKILYNKDKTVAVSCAGGVKSATLDRSCIKIKESCFYGHKNLENLTVNEKLNTIGNLSFYSAMKLTKIILPASLEIIGNKAFMLSKIETVIFEGEGPREIGYEAFRETKLDFINLGKNLESIGNLCFAKSPLRNLTIDIDCKLTIISEMAFTACQFQRFVLPRAVKIILNYAFRYDYNLTEFVFPENSSIESIGNEAFGLSEIESITLPKSIMTLSEYIWNHNQKLKTINFEPGTNIKQFGDGAWNGCISLESVTIPSSIEYLSSTIFLKCIKLRRIDVDKNNQNFSSVDGIVYSKDQTEMIMCPVGIISATIPNNTKNINKDAFYKCEQLESLEFQPGNSIKEIDPGTFSTCTKLTKIVLPTSLLTVKRNTFQKCPNLAVITFPDNLVCNLNDNSIFENCDSLINVSFGINCKLTSFGPKTFKGCSKLQTVTVPANCESISDECFANCISLNNITFQLLSKLKFIGSNAFNNCNSLNSFRIPDFFNNIAASIFGNAPNITTVIITANKHIANIESSAFQSFPLTVIIFEDGVTVNAFSDFAFAQTKISTIKVNIASLSGKYAFQNCSDLKIVTLTNSISSTKSLKSSNFYAIPEGFFDGCTKLETINIGF